MTPNDSTQGWRAQGSAETVLARLLGALAEISLDPDAVLEFLVRQCADLFGDLCGARMVSLDGQYLENRVWHHRDHALEGELHELLDPVVQSIEVGNTGRVVRSGKPTVYLKAPPDLRASAQTAYMEARGIAGVMLIPFASRGKVLGVLHLSRDRGSAPYTEEDRDLFFAICDRASLVYDNARLYRELARQGTILEQVDAAVVAVDTDGCITSWNPAAERLFGHARAEVLGRRGADVLSAPYSDEQLAAAREETLAIGWEGEWQMLRADGTPFPVWARASALTDENGVVTGIVGVFSDISAERRSQQLIERRALQHEAVAMLGERALEGGDPEVLFARAVDAAARTLRAQAALVQHSEDGTALVVRAAGGFEADPVGTVVPTEPSGGLAAYALATQRGLLTRDAAADPRFTLEPFLVDSGPGGAVAAVVQGRDRSHGVLVAVAPLHHAFGEADLRFLQSLANVLADAIDRWQGDQEQLRRALHDPLTGLPNRTLVLDRIDQALARIDRADGSLAILFLDIDHFKVINDGLGHGAGDELLAMIAPRLRGAVRPSDTVGRFGGDEFVMVCEGVRDEAMALMIARRVTEGCAAPFRIGGQDHHVTVSVGVVVCARGAHDAEALLRDADAAMYRAKERGRSRVELFDMGMRARAVERMQIERELRAGLDRDELRVWFQPILDLTTGEIASVEALVRWQHPERGMLQPSQFIHVAEESGLVVPLGRRVLELACLQAAHWPRDGHGRLRAVHVNLAAQQVGGAGSDLTAVVEDVLRTTRTPPQQLVLELTETALLERGAVAGDTLAHLVDLGVRFYLDDFGTGYSSLGYLDRFPIAGLKIDRSFVDGLGVHAEKTPIVKAILRMTEALGLDTVAEGVEREDQLAELRELGCTSAQGYLFARPMTGEALSELLLAGPLATAAPPAPRGLV